MERNDIIEEIVLAKIKNNRILDPEEQAVMEDLRRRGQLINNQEHWLKLNGVSRVLLFVGLGLILGIFLIN